MPDGHLRSTGRVCGEVQIVRVLIARQYPCGVERR